MRKTLPIYLVLFLILSIGLASASETLPTLLQPLEGGVVSPLETYEYTFKFTTDQNCINILKTDVQTVKTNGYGLALMNIDTTGLTDTPLYKCEYRDGVLASIHQISTGMYDNIYVAGDIYTGSNSAFKNNILMEGTLNVTGNVSLNSDLFINNNEIRGILHLHFNITNCNTGDEEPGVMCWNVDDDTIDIYTSSGQVIQVGREVSGLGINKEGSMVHDGGVVAMFGSQGDRPIFIKADGSNISKSSMVGIVTSPGGCANNDECPVTVFGFVRDIDTSAWPAGSKLYINASAPGNLTNIIPTLPNNPVWVATVIVSHANVGTIFVFPRHDPSNGFLSRDGWFSNNLTVMGDMLINGELQIGFTTGSIPFQGANGLTEDNTNLFWDDTNNMLGIGTSTPNYTLEVNGTTNIGGDLGVTDDIEALGIIHANLGLKSGSSDIGTYLELSDKIEKYGGVNGEYNYTTRFFCDFVSNNFVDTGGWVVITSENEFEGAMADIDTFINSSCVVLKNNPAWNEDITILEWNVEEPPVFIVNKGGFAEFYVGNDEQSHFMIRTKNGTGAKAAHIKSTSGTNGFQSIINSLDLKGFTTGVAENTILSSSIEVNGVHSDIYVIIGDTTDMSNSSLHFLDLTRLGNDETNTVDAIHLHGDFDNIIKTGAEDVINSSFDNDIDITLNVTGVSADVEVFTNNGDVLYIGGETNFTIIGISLSTGANVDINPNYYYCNSSNEWQLATGAVSDTTLGFKQSGKIFTGNPINRGVCNKELDGTPFSNVNNFTYIAIERNKVIVNTLPVINELTISGGSTSLILKEDILKLSPVSTPPETCSATWNGAIYYDNDVSRMCFCDGTNWLQIDDSTTSCS